mgnify:CR=1 FL=1
MKKNLLLKLYKNLQRFRSIELEISKRYSSWKMRCPTHLSVGQEAVPAAFSEIVKKNDFAVSSHRAHAHYLAKGGSLNKMIAELYGKKTGCSKGKGGSMHLIDLNVKAKGDTHIDLHHTTEDTGIAIGECLKKASNKFKGIKRYAHAMIPMDETLSRVAVDVSNRPYLIWKVKLKVEKLGEMDTELFKEWFQAFSQAAGVTLHIENIYGDNSHHIIESCFKGLARTLRSALEIDPRTKNIIPSTKGSL